MKHRRTHHQCVGMFVVLLLVFVFASCATDQTATSSGDRLVPASPEQVAQPEASPTPLPTPLPTPQPSATAVVIPPTPTPMPVLSRTMVFTGDVLSHTPVISQALRYGSDPATTDSATTDPATTDPATTDSATSDPATSDPATSDLAYDYRPMFAALAPRLERADLAICVLETPVSADNIGLDGYPTFEAPRELPDALVAAGYDGCSTASNHSYDRGAGGVRVTLDQMDRVGLGHSGMARTEAEAAVPRVYDLDGVVVAHLSYSYSLNGFRLPDDEPWLVNLNDVDAIVDEATRARAGGADLVVLSIQWGNEYQREPSAEQLSLASALTSSGEIDLIMGNHVHVVQPVATVHGVPVVYGLGNSLSNQSDNCCRTGTQDGVLIEATITGSEERAFHVTALAFAPTWVDRTNYTIIDLLTALDDPDLDPDVRSVYERSLKRTAEAVHSLAWEIPLAD